MRGTTFIKYLFENILHFSSFEYFKYQSDRNSDTEIDVMAVDHQHKQVFAAECKYHVKPIDASIYFDLKEKVMQAKEISKAFPHYQVVYGIFCNSGFTTRLVEVAKEAGVLLFYQNNLM